MQSPTERQKMACPLNGKTCINGRREDFQKDDVGAPVQCRWWQHILGVDPQTGNPVDHWDCSVPWVPVLLVENAQMTRHATASVDKTANILFGALPDTVRDRVVKMNPSLRPPTGTPPALLPNGNGKENGAAK